MPEWLAEFRWQKFTQSRNDIKPRRKENAAIPSLDNS
jgi:hypothetical protein